MAQKNSLGDAGKRHHQLHQLLRSALPPESECEAYLPRLASYVDAQLAGEDYLTRYADIAIHLDNCPACAGAYARLYELEVALAQQALPAPNVMPTPDLSFLSRPEAKPSPTLVDLLSAALTTTANKIRLQLTPALLALLQPQQAAPLTRSPVDDSRYYEVLYELQAQQSTETTIPIRLIAYRDAQRPEQCLLEVTVVPPGVSWPNLGGYTVTLQMGNDRLTAITDAWGIAPFLDLPIARLDDLTLEVELVK